MKILSIVLLAMLSFVTLQISSQHKFLTLESMKPDQLVGLVSGDWKSILPQPLKNLLTKQKGTENKAPIPISFPETVPLSFIHQVDKLQQPEQKLSQNFKNKDNQKLKVHRMIHIH